MLVPFLLIASALGADSTVSRRAVPVAALETYRTSVGKRIGDTLVATLELRESRWRPQGARAIEVPVYVFAEPGIAPKVPGPMLRLNEGGTVRLTLRNTLGKRVVVRGLQGRPFKAEATDSVALLPGGDTTITFAAGDAGSYFYWARVTPTVNHRVAPIPGDLWGGENAEGPFIGTFIVDPKGARPDPNERTFLITRWLDEYLPAINDTVDWKLTLNGGSYPNTEPLTYAVGDTVRWRVINATLASHPMHLHGFYYRVLGKGDVSDYRPIAEADRKLVVTELLDAGQSMRLEWVPERAGNWLFHCHLVRHMTGQQNLPADPDVTAVAHAGHEHEMAGLVLGITVRAKGATALADERLAGGAVRVSAKARAIRLLAQTRPKVYGAAPGYAFVVQNGTAAPSRDSIVQPSTTLVLRKGEPVRITVVNRLANALAVHWHGMELESWYDGVGGFSGMGSRMRAPIAPRDSFVVQFTPPRSGTFMYHTHDEKGQELASGLQGALLVVDDPAKFDATRDHLFLLSTRGPTDSGIVAVNGRANPPPLVLTPGEHRLRFATISSNEQVVVSLVKGDSVLTWQVVARDGADVSVAQRAAKRAELGFSAGITTDVLVNLPPGEGYAIRVRMQPYEAFEFAGSEVRVPIVRR